MNDELERLKLQVYQARLKLERVEQEEREVHAPMFSLQPEHNSQPLLQKQREVYAPMLSLQPNHDLQEIERRKQERQRLTPKDAAEQIRAGETATMTPYEQEQIVRAQKARALLETQDQQKKIVQTQGARRNHQHELDREQQEANALKQTSLELARKREQQEAYALRQKSVELEKKRRQQLSQPKQQSLALQNLQQKQSLALQNLQQQHQQVLYDLQQEHQLELVDLQQQHQLELYNLHKEEHESSTKSTARIVSQSVSAGAGAVARIVSQPVARIVSQPDSRVMDPKLKAMLEERLRRNGQGGGEALYQEKYLKYKTKYNNLKN